MIEQKQVNTLILQDGDDIQETIKMSLDLDSANTIMQILSKNLYSDSVGSCVREICTNSLDSMRDVGVTDRPIIVTFGRTNNGNYEFTVEDFGKGLSHEDVINIISKYGKSTKRLSASQLGYYGLGWKSPLAYTSSFTFITRKNGIERKYIMSEGEEENIIDLIDESDTTLDNGVKVIVPVNSYDRNDFYKKIKEQLCYFESIYFNVTCDGKTIDNNFKITRYEDFQMSELNEDKTLHICLDNVYYPLDFKKLGIDIINVPIGLRFGLSDGIFPTPSREAIRMSVEAKTVIIEKIKTVASKVVEMYNKSIDDSDDFYKIDAYYSSNSRYIDIGHKQDIDISGLVGYSNIAMKEPKLKGISLLNIKKIVNNKDEIVSEYDVVYEIRRGKMKERKHSEYLPFSYIKENFNIYKFAYKLGGNKKEYLKFITAGGSYLIKKKRRRTLFPSKTVRNSYYDKGCACYYTLLNLTNYPKSQWRQAIKEFQFIQERFEKQIKDVDAIEIPKAWLDSRKAARVYVSKKNGHQKLEGEVSCRRAEHLERYVDGKTCKFTPFSIDLGKIGQKSIFYIYTTHDNSLKLDTLFEKVKKQKVELITFSEREINKLKDADIHNLITYEKFMKGENTIFKKLVTAHLVNALIQKNRNVFNSRTQVANISTHLAEKLIKLNTYANKNYNSGGSDDFFAAMIEVADKYFLYDNSIYQEYLETKDILDKFRFLETIYDEIRDNGYNKEKSSVRDRILIDLLKYNKYKVNLEHYKQPVVVEQTETTI